MRTGKHSDIIETAKARSALRPFRQGSLDAYCGFYAIANAMLKIKPEAFEKEESPAALLRAMMKAASRICTPEELVHDGMDDIELVYVAKSGIRHMQRIGHGFHLVRPSRLGLGSPHRDQAKWFVDAAALPSAAVILYIDEGDQSHWSVLMSAAKGRLYLFDSDGMGAAKVAQCQPILAIARAPP